MCSYVEFQPVSKFFISANVIKMGVGDPDGDNAPSMLLGHLGDVLSRVSRVDDHRLTRGRVGHQIRVRLYGAKDQRDDVQHNPSQQ